MTDRNSAPGVQGCCFVLRYGDRYLGCVRVQQAEFYSTAQPTHQDAMLEAEKLTSMLYQEEVLIDCVCLCRQKSP